MMTTRQVTKFVQEGEYGAAVNVQRIELENGWAPYLGVEDALKLDRVREALRSGHLKEASAIATVYRLVSIAV
jgi:hypothetical protein